MATTAETLESLVDKVGLHVVLSQLAAVCADKQEHIASAWQDATLARAWDKAGNAVQRCADSAAVRKVQP